MASVAQAHGYPHTETANPHWVSPPDKAALAHIPGEEGLPFVGTTLKVI
nr:hypothetical protein [Sphingorhabdus sp.]